MIATNVSNEGKKVITLTPQTAGGKATKIDTSDFTPTATVAEGEGEASVEVTEDGKLAVTVQGEIGEGEDFGTVTITVEADADMDAGEERRISETIVLTVTPAEASGFSAEIGEETPRA